MEDIFISSRKSNVAKVSKKPQIPVKRSTTEIKRCSILTQMNLSHFTLFSSLGYWGGSYLNGKMNNSFDLEQLGQFFLNLRTVILYTILGLSSFFVYRKFKKELLDSQIHIFVLTVISVLFFILIGISPLGNWWNTFPDFIEITIYVIGIILFFPALLSLLFLPVCYFRLLLVKRNESS